MHPYEWITITTKAELESHIKDWRDSRSISHRIFNRIVIEYTTEDMDGKHLATIEHKLRYLPLFLIAILCTPLLICECGYKETIKGYKEWIVEEKRISRLYNELLNKLI